MNKIQKLQERALRFVLKYSISDYETLLSKSDWFISNFIHKNYGSQNLQDFKWYEPKIFVIPIL